MNESYILYQINLKKGMVEENISQKFKLKNIDEARNYFIEEINQNELVSKKHKYVCTTLNYIEHLLMLASLDARCVLISALASLIGIIISTTSSAVELKVCAITPGFTKYN